MLYPPIVGRDVSEATESLLRNIQSFSTHATNRVFYFHGWSGFGVTPVLRRSRQHLPSAERYPRLRHHRLIYIDCSDWKNRRMLQRKIAEELNFGQTIMDMFDKQDEADDFNGVGEASRDLIINVSAMIDKTLRERNFVIIFLNGSGEELDLADFGVPTFTKFADNIMIWSYKGRFLTIQEPGASSKLSVQLRYTHVLLLNTVELEEISASEFYDLLREEAGSIVARHPCIQGIDLTMVADCCFYEMFLYYSFHHTTGFAWAAHACNFWICDGIVKGDRAKEICDTLYPEIRWECDASSLDSLCQNIMQNDPETHFMVINDDDDTVRKKKPACRWFALTSKNFKVQDQDMDSAMNKASSLFIAFERTDSDNVPAGLPDGLFKHCSNLGVPVLFCCAFSFASPPFVQCRGLRFLGLERCTDDLTRDEEEEECTNWEFLCNLQVLDLRYTCWDEILSEEKTDLMVNLRELNIEGVRCWQYISQLQTKLPHLERLRIIKPMKQQEANTSPDMNNSFLDKTKLEILDFSGNSDMKELPTSLSNASRLQMLVLDGCDGLENVDVCHSSLTSVSLDGYGPASRWTSTVELPPESDRPERPSDQDKRDVKISKISLKGCTQLKNLFLRELSNLMELDLSGSALKVLDFRSMVTDVPRLKRLFLLGCQHLRAIKWVDSDSQMKLELLCIDTRPGTWTLPSPAQQHESSKTLQVHAVLADMRLVRSLGYIIDWEKALFDIRCSAVNGAAVQLQAATSSEAIEPTGVQRLHYLASLYADVLDEIGDAPMEAFPEPPEGRLDRHVEITGDILESELHSPYDNYNLAFVMIHFVESLHVHDVSISVSMPDREWHTLKWCRVERCPSLEASLFHQDAYGFSAYGFSELEVVWVSELAMARCFWSTLSTSWRPSFKSLRHLHLRSCPRLQHVLPLRRNNDLQNLETIYVVHCSSLRHVFALGEDLEDDITSTGVEFSRLTTIHLHDLPMLRGVCEVKRMYAPKLETVRIRGCFNLRRLPAPCQRGGVRRSQRPTVEVEKDVWDALEWDGEDVGHHPNYYEPPVHSRHYRNKGLLRRSVLR